jgi:hypothetical protein
MVPVRESVPVELSVAVDIPIEETELNDPFGDLQSIFGPLGDVLSRLPDDNREVYRRAIFGSLEAVGDSPG